MLFEGNCRFAVQQRPGITGDSPGQLPGCLTRHCGLIQLRPECRFRADKVHQREQQQGAKVGQAGSGISGLDRCQKKA